MRKTMRVALVATMLFGVATTAAPEASANAAGNTIHGGCFFHTDQSDLLTNGQNEGVIGDVSTTTGPSGVPTGATVTCLIRVNGTEAPVTRHIYGGTGAQAGSDQIIFAAGPDDTIVECEDVVYADDTTEDEYCRSVYWTRVPPLEVVDLLDGVSRTLEPNICPTLVTLGQATHGGVPGTFEIRADGDIFVADPWAPGTYYWAYDCPPYYNDPGGSLTRDLFFVVVLF